MTGNSTCPRKRKDRARRALRVRARAEAEGVLPGAPAQICPAGFACLLIETIQRGEIEGHHHGTFHRGWFNWYSQGYTPRGVELWTGIRALDLLASLPEVDGDRLGVTGISGGGAVSGGWAAPTNA